MRKAAIQSPFHREAYAQNMLRKRADQRIVDDGKTTNYSESQIKSYLLLDAILDGDQYEEKRFRLKTKLQKTKNHVLSMAQQLEKDMPALRDEPEAVFNSYLKKLDARSRFRQSHPSPKPTISMPHDKVKMPMSNLQQVKQPRIHWGNQHDTHDENQQWSKRSKTAVSDWSERWSKLMADTQPEVIDVDDVSQNGWEHYNPANDDDSDNQHWDYPETSWQNNETPSFRAQYDRDRYYNFPIPNAKNYLQHGVEEADYAYANFKGATGYRTTDGFDSTCSTSLATSDGTVHNVHMAQSGNTSDYMWRTRDKWPTSAWDTMVQAWIKRGMNTINFTTEWRSACNFEAIYEQVHEDEPDTTLHGKHFFAPR